MIYLTNRHEGFLIEIGSLTNLSRPIWYYKTSKDDSEVIDKFIQLAELILTTCFGLQYKHIHLGILQWNRKRALRIYGTMNVKLNISHKNRIINRVKQFLQTQSELNKYWNIDFMGNALTEKVKK